MTTTILDERRVDPEQASSPIDETEHTRTGRIYNHYVSHHLASSS